MKDVPKLGGPDSLFYKQGYNPRMSAPGLSGSSSHQFSASSQPGAGQPPPASQHQTKVDHTYISSKYYDNIMLQKTGKWNAMHVRIAWEIYNHQQKAKTDAKSNVQSVRPPATSFDLSHKTGITPGSDFTGKRPGPPQDLVRGHSQPNIFPPPGLPPPHNLHLDPYSAQRYYGASHLGQLMDCNCEMLIL